ncbi:MAG: hydrogenase maturation protease [Anaerolineae bacterium]|uniref:hydrogenase maturation protease n=1 Tax=Candidatus Flexifilum breve TaxID=3140694 RepID=UPI001AC199C4|nr:hydrogenase maturation protease [Chloroflexota bacterium]MBK9749386.1 hydrogenase maturation protease [Chloroflexota bacterium]MBN8636253.1 hydrogenase maturation protease [Anaerolineae bacterium]
MTLWSDVLKQEIQPGIKVAVMGVGQILSGDDGVGVLIARQLREHIPSNDHRLIIDAGLAPENFTGLIRKVRPELIIVIDAAQMNEPPGTVHLIPWQYADGICMSTHTLPLKMMCSYLTDQVGCDIALIGIQVGDAQFGHPPTSAVTTAAAQVALTLEDLLRLPEPA